MTHEAYDRMRPSSVLRAPPCVRTAKCDGYLYLSHFAFSFSLAGQHSLCTFLVCPVQLCTMVFLTALYADRFRVGHSGIMRLVVYPQLYARRGPNYTVTASCPV